MRDNAPTTRSGLDFLRHVGFWVLVPLATYVAYVLIDVVLRPDPARLPELAARLPFIVGQILPVAVFAATSGRSGLFGGFDGESRHHLWVAVALVAGAAYAILALPEPILAPFTGSDALFPPGLDQAAEIAREAARNTSGPESEALLREAGGYLMRLVVPFATAAMVFVAAALGSLVSVAIREIPQVRCVAGGILAGFYWGSLGIAEELAVRIDLSAIALFALLMTMPLVMPLLIIAMACAHNWWSDR